MTIAIVLVASIAGVFLLLWLGLQIKPKPFPAFAAAHGPLEQVPLPGDLPAPVTRFYQEIYGGSVPLIESAVVSGRAKLRINGITFPARYRFSHIAGQDYRHYIEATLFGLPIMKVSEHYVDGKALLELPFGMRAEGTKVDQGANLAIWAEAMWFPAIFVTDARVEWQAVDAHTALMTVPFQDQRETFVLRFDPQTGLLDMMESMRFKGEQSETKTLWINAALSWDTVDGQPLPAVGSVTWFDEGTPWAVFNVEELDLNADLSEYIRAEGP